jgi:quercetin dioxygenase-like cupin family protein
MQIKQARESGKPSELRQDTFTGEVWGDPVLPHTDDVMINNVFFAPKARTHWHSHRGGQVLHVLAGEGKACVRGGRPETIRAGDVVFFPPGEEHWHGGGDDSYLLHLAISLGAAHDWLEPVSDADYAG